MQALVPIASVAVLIASMAAIFCSASVVESMLEDIVNIKNGESYAVECFLNSGLRIDSLQALKSGNFSSSGDGAKCLVKCFFEKAGFMNAQGALQEKAIVEQLTSFLSKKQVESMVKNCNIQGTNSCDTAYRVSECYFKNKAGLF
ncbi:general odorant-binding protein 56d-like [Topomyia yanbarensis]|uniref:general odorant-binding protein 56d-like n=1 Tax=Topomyia yanbarensis TaxID=2498891 RepID=UPI00273C8848|nr:general odorant-binding protein 56d-like [Topomyia yanbarensis]